MPRTIVPSSQLDTAPEGTLETRQQQSSRTHDVMVRKARALSVENDPAAATKDSAVPQEGYTFLGEKAPIVSHGSKTTATPNATF